MKIWKMSLGSQYNFSNDTFNYMLENSLIAINHDAEKSQGNAFINLANIGDIFYLYRNKSIVLLGKIVEKNIGIHSLTANQELLDATRVHRYEILKRAIEIPEFRFVDLGQEKWLPSGNSTFFEVPRNNYKDFEDKILTPFFDIKLNEIGVIEETRFEDNQLSSKERISMNQPLNRILFGPPGTGKTYNTINHALQIIEPNCSLNDRTQLIKKFQDYVSSGQIVFTTFHQSYGYEEFIEGIKPDMDASESGEVRYTVKDGVFKKIAITALYDMTAHNFQEATIGFDELYDQLIDLVKQGLPFELESINSKLLQIRNVSDRDNLHVYHNDSKQRHIVGKERLKALYYKFDSIKKLESINSIKDEITNIIGGCNATAYWSILHLLLKIKSGISYEEINTPYTYNEKKKFLLTSGEHKYSENQVKKYVFIIDEINRGNISKIFGELITLIEPSKRLGSEDGEELTVKLPYSGETFGVPSNVYIIGTMNTADRSIALMDTALRRRFEFIEMMPNYDVIKDQVGSIEIDQNKTIDISELLRVINERISYLYDRDHQIGHAYFMGIKTIDDLNSVFRNKIIPLLQEYFYDDWEKIQMVLGDHEQQKAQNLDKFIVSEDTQETTLFGFNHDDIEDKKITYRINPKFTDNAYLKISGQLKSKGSEQVVEHEQTAQ